jgi:photosystem II stability/assembly factor-like uncharacterized protein
MALLVGTAEGVYRAPGDDVTASELVLDAPQAYRLRALPEFDGVFAATGDGLSRSADGGDTWTDEGVPGAPVSAVAASPDGRVLYAGTDDPADVYVRHRDEEEWTRRDGLRRFPDRDRWDNFTGGARVRALRTDPDAPDRVVAAVEAVGVYVSGDGGETWERRSRGVHEDVHDLRDLGGGRWVASTGRGLYRTDDAGRTWLRLDTDRDRFWYSYYREALAHDGVLYASAQDRAAARHDAGAGGVLLASGDGGWTLRRVPFPVADDDFVTAWTVHDGAVYAGTEGGRVLRRAGGERAIAQADGGWQQVGSVSATVHALHGV